MSECVVRMEMPESCDICPCLDDYGDYPRCRISAEKRGYNFPIREKRMPNCPIICQLPEGHGPLVDKDEMLKKIENYHRYMTMHHRRFSHHLEGNLTHVVPAERSEA